MKESTRCSVAMGDKPAHHWSKPDLAERGNHFEKRPVASPCSFARWLASMLCCPPCLDSSLSWPAIVEFDLLSILMGVLRLKLM